MKTKLIKIFIVLIIIFGFIGVCLAAWDNTKPADSDAWNTAAGSIRNNWDILEVELGIDIDEAHPYYQALAPTFKPDGVTAFDGDDLGRIWIDSDNYRTYVLTAAAPTWTAIILELANNTYFTAVDAAGTGTVDLIMANAADVAVLPDGSELATSGAPTADADIANKKYVDDMPWTRVCRIWCDAAAVMTANQWTLIPHDTDDYDPDNISVLGTNRITPDEAGYYQVNVGCYVESITAGDVLYGIAIYQNGASVSQVYNTVPTTVVGVSHSDILYFNGTTDYVQSYFYNGHGADDGALSGLQVNDFLSVARIGL